MESNDPLDPQNASQIPQIDIKLNSENDTTLSPEAIQFAPQEIAQSQIVYETMDQSIPKINSSGISIKVADPILKNDKYSLTFHVYALRGSDKDGAYETFRRYSEFLTVRTILVNRWPGCYIPPIPPKKTVGNKESTFIEDRRRFLDKFCKQVADIPYLYYSEEFQIFLRSNNPDIEKALNTLAKPSSEDIISKYSVTFSQLSGKELNNETVSKILQFYAFLKKAEVTFKNFKKIAKEMANAKKQYYGQFNLFHNMCMVEYEKNCTAEYTGNKENKFIFNQPNNLKLSNTLTKLKEAAQRDSLEKIYEFIKQESYEISAFAEAISMRDKYEGYRAKTQERQKSETADLQKIIGGKSTFKTIFSTKSKEEDISSLEKQIVKTTKEVENLTMIHDMITLIIAYTEIDKYKEAKIGKYHTILKQCAEAESANNSNIQDYWSVIFENAINAERS